MKIWKTIAAAAIATVLSAASGANAAPVNAGTVALAQSSAEATLPLEQVQYRRGGPGYRYAYRGGGWYRPPVILGLGAAVVAGAIIANSTYVPRRGYYYDTYAYDGPYYYPSDYRGDPREICARYFRSFEWETGMYTTYGGERRLCPYLR